MPTYAIVEFRDRRGNPRARIVAVKNPTEPIFSGEDYADTGKRSRELKKFFAAVEVGSVVYWTEKDIAKQEAARAQKGAAVKSRDKSNPRAKAKPKPKPSKPRALKAVPAASEAIDMDSGKDGCTDPVVHDEGMNSNETSAAAGSV